MQKEINTAYGTVEEAIRARKSGDYYSAMIANDFGAMGEYVAVSATDDESAIDECFTAATNYHTAWCGMGEAARLVSVTHHMRGNVGDCIYREI